ncbi:uncharacterized protein [Cicer arietinum]|uniref:Probable zinc transporter protein DDB_G0291141 isoform X2 n=1 Tax=Cicer arietinum TaxID=3827 RepID=A0A1S2YKT7_CICAR|nr:probable zinc transporter protein DDB_G0291141 isoform X2 [Cicer arietinum]
MSDFHHHHHHQHRPHRLSVPPRTTTTTTTPKPYTPNSTFPYSSSSSILTLTPTPTPSKTRKNPNLLSSSFSFNSKSKSKSNSNSNSKSISFIFLFLFSLRSLYSLFPFLRSSSPSFSLFPFSFLVSLLSFFLTLFFSFFSFSLSSSKNPFLHKPKQQPIFNFSSITQSQQRILISKSILLAFVFLLRFQALRYCGTAAMIIAEFMGTVTARWFRRNQRNGWGEIRGFVSLFSGLFMLSFGWDRIECFPFGGKNEGNCVRVWQLLMPFMSGFLACYEQCVSFENYESLKQLGRKRVRLITLFFTTVVLCVPAVISFFVYEGGEDSVSFGNMVWPLANTVVFGVLLSENYFGGVDDLVSFKDSKREFVMIFMCTLILELFYYPNISLWGLLICGLLLYVAVRDLDPFDFHDLGFGDESSSQLLSDIVMKPIRHILSERKSRKIALFLLINAGYMVVEFVAGFMSNSLGLISDACHMLFDCAALAIGLYASYISRLPANNHYNYGRGRFEVLSGYTNAVFLVLVGALIVVESFERILDPQEISTNSLLVVSIGGLVVNVIGLIFFHEEHHHAHGMSGGSCSHSHAHSVLHNHHSDHHHERHGSNREFIPVSSDCQDNSHSHKELHNHHSDHHHERHGSNREFISVSSDCQDNSCAGDVGHHNNAQQHDHHEHAAHCHDHHHQTDHHDHHSHESKTDCLADTHNTPNFKHHDLARQHDHHDHNHHASHHDHNHHASHHDHHDHNHHASHHDHSDCHDQNHHDHQHHDHHHLDADQQKHSHRHIDHNMEGIFLHVLADTLGSVGVVISTLLIKYKGWLVADPACSIFISILIVSSVIPLLRNSAEVLLQRIPRAHEHEVKDSLVNVLKIKGVYGIQKFHSWSFTNTDVIGTLHLHVSSDTDKILVKSQDPTSCRVVICTEM